MKTAIQIIRDAYAYAGIAPTGTPLNGDMSREGLGFLNEVIYQLNSDNYFPFTNNTLDGIVKNGVAKISPDEGAEFVGEKPLHINKVLWSNGGEWIPLFSLSYENIWEHRGACSQPTYYAFSNDEYGNGILTFDNDNGEFKCRVIYNKNIPEMDYNDLLKTPPQYEQLLKYGVSLKVCTRYGLPADNIVNIQREYDAILSSVKKNNSYKHEINRPVDNFGAFEDHTIAILSGRHL